MQNYEKEYVKYKECYNAMLQWLLLKQKRKSISEYLYKQGYRKLAIYGMSDIGNCLYGDLIEKQFCDVLYAIDQGVPKLYYDIMCYNLS